MIDDPERFLEDFRRAFFAELTDPSDDYRYVAYRFVEATFVCWVSFPYRWALPRTFQEGKRLFRFTFDLDLTASPRDNAEQLWMELGEALYTGVGQVEECGWLW